ncbi:MAG: tRNA (adenine-N(6)-)-methyltransferase [Flavobacteriales bacterium]|nr:MAG: tRNA (adenine-N(6)-)-methyltransferase [Flavobacteriales bacterium]
MSVFQLKQFNVNQADVSMKIGTDAMVLGAWAPVNDAETILDIGTGTGILALMLAQRSDAFTIDAVEIDAKTFERAVENFEHSPWADRLFCYHASIQEFADEIDETYDFIISNPPYFEINQTTGINPRTTARQTHHLNHSTLLKVTKQLLHPNGSCAFSLPFVSEQPLIAEAENLGFKVYKILRMKDKADTSYSRSFLQLGFGDKPTQTETLVLKEDSGAYSADFKALTQAFYPMF